MIDRPTSIPEPCLHLLIVLRDRVACDHHIRGDKIKVLLYLLPDLLGREYQPVKQRATAHALRMSQQGVQRCLAVLVAQQQLDRGPNDGQLYTYRVSTRLLTRLVYTNRESRTA